MSNIITLEPDVPLLGQDGLRPVLRHVKRWLLFRYPGGKSYFADQLLVKMGDNFKNAEYFCDLFVGGGSVSMAAAFADRQKKIVMNDLNTWMSSFWDCLNDPQDCNYLLQLIHSHKPTMETFNALREKQLRDSIDGGGWPRTKADRAFCAVFFNRTTFSGKMDGPPIGGWKQKSSENPDGIEKKWDVSCRYHPKRLEKKINYLSTLFRDRLTVWSRNTCDVLNKKDLPKNSLVYLDPPYWGRPGRTAYVKGFKTESEHFQLRDAVKNFGKKVFISYGDEPEIRNLYSGCKFHELETTYVMAKKRELKPAKELLIETV